MSFWLDRPRANFSTACAAYFAGMEDVQPEQVARAARYGKPLKARPSRLIHVIPDAKVAHALRGRKLSRVKQAGSRIAERAMRTSGSLVGVRA